MNTHVFEGIIVVFCVACIMTLETLNIILLHHDGMVLTTAMTIIGACVGFMFARYAKRGEKDASI